MKNIAEVNGQNSILKIRLKIESNTFIIKHWEKNLKYMYPFLITLILHVIILSYQHHQRKLT